MPVNVSPLIRGGRWAALLVGVSYGYVHNRKITKVRKSELAIQEIKAKEDAIALEAKKAAEATSPSILS